MPRTLIENDLRINFEEFLIHAFSKTHEKRTLCIENYLRYVCDRYQKLDHGDRVVFNQPPRSLKSWTAKIFATWYLGRHPSNEVMIISNTQRLSETIAYDVRNILRSAWYLRIFPEAEISRDRAGVKQLKLKRGGGVFAGSVEGSLAGFGADLLIVDDPNKIDDAHKPDHLDAVNAKFDGEILSRLNSQKKGIVVVVQHRLNEGDLSGHLLQKGYQKIVFPLRAPRKTQYKLSNGVILERQKNEILIPSAYSKKGIEDLEKGLNPPFFWFYQQGMGQQQQLQFEIRNFPILQPRGFVGPPVISIDTAQRQNAASSFNVIQVWQQTSDTFHLVEQFRERCEFAELERAARSHISRHRPAAILIENAALGPALLSRLSQKFGKSNLIPVEPLKSKSERLHRHRATICKSRISLSKNIPFTYIYEFLDFPSGTNDQVDATTQYLDFMAGKPVLMQSEPKVRAVLRLHSADRTTSESVDSLRPSSGLALGSHFPRKRY